MERPQPVRNERARTYELDTDERRRIIRREEWPRLPGVVWKEGRVFPDCVALVVGVVSQAPIRRRVWLADAHDRVSGTGLLSQMLERGWWPAHAAGASAPGAW